MTSPLIISRRKFLLGASALSATGALSSLEGAGLVSALAQSAPSDYRALVCIFLNGGNDGNNLVIPRDGTAQALYASARGAPANGGLALDPASLVAINPPSQSGGFGFHPQLAPLKSVWDAGRLAVLCNVGTLVEPMSKAEYSNGSKRKPEQLFSHSDQVTQWQTAISNEAARTGWGGRLADQLGALNGTNTFPMVTSISGTALYTVGNTPKVVAVPATGTFGLNGFNTTASSQARMNALRELLLLNSGNEFVREADDVYAQAIDASGILNPIITTSSATINTAFGTLNTSLANQLKQVARLIEARNTTGLKRQIFFVALGGWDTHTNQLVVQDGLLQQVGAAMKAFYDATGALGVASNVTTFTLTDFGRTLKAASGAGSDHGWGTHQLIMGGSVRGGDFYGRFPDLTLGGPDDTATSGRWIPTTSVDQYAATLAQWLGLSASNLPLVLPNIGRFASNNLGFLT